MNPADTKAHNLKIKTFFGFVELFVIIVLCYDYFLFMENRP